MGDVAGDFLNEDGKIIGNDGIDDKKVYVLKTTETNFDGGALSAGISKEAAEKTEAFIKNNDGNTEAFKKDDIAYKNSIEIIGDPIVRQEMVNIIKKDNGSGGTSDANNREYGGIVRDGKVIESKPGAVGNPQNNLNVSIEHSGVKNRDLLFHSHPIGYIVEGSGNKNVVGSGSSVGELTTTYYWRQPTSQQDVSVGTQTTEYVFGRGNGKVYIYNKSGIISTILQKRFVNPKK